MFTVACPFRIGARVLKANSERRRRGGDSSGEMPDLLNGGEVSGNSNGLLSDVHW